MPENMNYVTLDDKVTRELAQKKEEKNKKD